MTNAPMIVVGVDGSPSSRDAVLWAADYARLADGSLRLVYAWSPPVVATMAPPPLAVDWEELREQAKAFPAAFGRAALGETPDVSVTSVTETGSPAQVLVDASAHADLLVIGSRGLGGLRGMMLGSVGHHCAAHAECPVVVMHTPHDHKPRTVRRDALRHDAPVAGQR